MRAVAVKPGLMESEQVTAKLIIKRRCSPPEFRAGAGAGAVAGAGAGAGAGKAGGKGKQQGGQGGTASAAKAVEKMTMSIGEKLTMATQTWNVLPDAKIHYTIERLGVEGGDGDVKISGFFDGEGVSLPSIGRWSVKAVAMHPTMLPSLQASLLLECVAPAQVGASVEETHSQRRGSNAEARGHEEVAAAGSDSIGHVGVRVRVPGSGNGVRGSRSSRTSTAAAAAAHALSSGKQGGGNAHSKADKRMAVFFTWFTFVALVVFFLYRLVAGSL